MAFLPPKTQRGQKWFKSFDIVVWCTCLVAIWFWWPLWLSVLFPGHLVLMGGAMHFPEFSRVSSEPWKSFYILHLMCTFSTTLSHNCFMRSLEPMLLYSCVSEVENWKAKQSKQLFVFKLSSQSLWFHIAVGKLSATFNNSSCPLRLFKGC